MKKARQKYELFMLWAAVYSSKCQNTMKTNHTQFMQILENQITKSSCQSKYIRNC